VGVGVGFAVAVAVAVSDGEGFEAGAGVAVGRGLAIAEAFGTGVGLRRAGEGVVGEDRGPVVELESGRTVGKVIGARVIAGVASGFGVVTGKTLAVGTGEAFSIGG
jgi:hypothetical protein